MSQRNVEKVIGRLVTDEAFRAGFAKDPEKAMRDLAQRGIELTACEMRALRSVDLRVVTAFADRIDPCLQKCDLKREAE